MLSTTLAIAINRLIERNKSILLGIELLYGCTPNIICQDYSLA